MFSRFQRTLVVLTLYCVITGEASARTLEFDTTEVTGADVALSPDGESLIFSMVGHLFHLAVEGGVADQLTFGPYYDTNPVFSPDGTRVAYASDRDGSESNVFVLELATDKITQVTREVRAIRPTWSPDGEAIVYLCPMRELAHYQRSIWGPLPSLVRRISVNGGEPETLVSPAREIRSLFYLPDGRLALTALERQAGTRRVDTRIEVMNSLGQFSTLRVIEGIVDRVVTSPTGDGLYCRRIFQLDINVEREDLIFFPLPEGPERGIMSVTGSGRGWGTGRWHWSPTFAVAADEKTLYVGNAGRLWIAENPRGTRKPIDFSAHVNLEVQELGPPLKWAPTEAGGSVPVYIDFPVLSTDGQSLVFKAGGYLWRQKFDGNPAERLFDGSGFEGDPAFSPDGRRFAYTDFDPHVHSQVAINIGDFESRESRLLGRFEDPEFLTWSPDGKRIAFIDDTEEIKVIDLQGQTHSVASGGFHRGVSWNPDGERLIFCNHEHEGFHQVVAVNISDGTREVLADELPLDTGDVRLSPDGETLYYSTNCGFEIWAKPLGLMSSGDEDTYRVSVEGGDTYAFTPDGSSLIYSIADRVWRDPLDGGQREEMPVRLQVRRPTPPPMLLRRVRVLDFVSGGFGEETSLFIEEERIRWIGSERGRRLPAETVILDTEGRWAIPGLLDMHNHGGDPAAYVAYGVTSVRDVGAEHHMMNTYADRSAITTDPMPRLFHGGAAFLGPRLASAEPYGAVLGDEDDARACTRSWRDRGAVHIKAYASLSWPLHRVVAEEARLQGLAIVAHGESVEEATKGVTLGYWSLEHIGSRERFYDDVLQMLALAGTRWCPTLGNIGHSEWMLRNESERLEDPKFRRFNTEQLVRRVYREDPYRAVGNRMLLGFVTEGRAAVQAAYRRGVHILAGSHATIGAFPGASMHWEIEHFVAAGIKPLDALRMATIEGAAAVGAEDELGTLEPGKLADIVLLDANPLEDIKNTQRIWRVIKAGSLFDPDNLHPPRTANIMKKP